MEDYDEIDERFEPDETSSEAWIWWLVAGLALVLLGGAGYVSGMGWFGYRPLLYGQGELYVMNRTGEVASISVDGRPSVEVKPDHYELFDLVGGTSHVRVRRGGESTTYTVETDHSDAFLRLSIEECLVATDVTPFYGSSESPDTLEIVDRIREGEHVYVPGSYNVMWPQHSFPDQLPGTGGPGIWIETVGCPLFEEPNYLQTYLMVRLRDRLGIADRGSTPGP